MTPSVEVSLGVTSFRSCRSFLCSQSVTRPLPQVQMQCVDAEVESVVGLPPSSRSKRPTALGGARSRPCSRETADRAVVQQLNLRPRFTLRMPKPLTIRSDWDDSPIRAIDLVGPCQAALMSPGFAHDDRYCVSSPVSVGPACADHGGASHMAGYLRVLQRRLGCCVGPCFNFS